MPVDGSIAPAVAQEPAQGPAGELETLSCVGCGYGIAPQRPAPVRPPLPTCPMCGGDRWEPARESAPRRLWGALL